MLFYKKKKNQKTQNSKGERILITINVINYVGPIRFIVFEEELVSNVIDTALKTYARQCRFPVLGNNLQDFVLYCSHVEQQRMNPWETIGSIGARNFLLCKKPKCDKVVLDERLTDSIYRKGNGGVWKSWFNKHKIKGWFSLHLI